MTNPSYVASTKGGVNGTTFNMTVPATAAVDDILLLVRCANTASSAFVALSSPWTQAMSPIVSGSNTLEAWWRPVASGIPGSTVASAVTVSTKHSATLVVARDVHLTTPIHNISSTNANDTTPAQTTPTFVTTQPSYIFEFWTERSSTPSTSTTISGSTKIQEQFLTGSAAISIVAANDGFVGTPGTVGGDTLTWSSSASAFKFKLTVALLSEDATGGTHTPATIRRWNGTTMKSGATLKRWNGTTFKTGATIRRWNGTSFVPAP